jgi:hypothetical protein
VAFNSGKTYSDMLAVAQEVAQDQWQVLQTPFEQALEQQRERMREISGEWIRSGTSDKVLDAQLEEVYQVIMLILEKIPELDKETCAKVTKAAIDCFWESLMAAL